MSDDQLTTATELAMLTPAQMAEEYLKLISLRNSVEDRYQKLRAGLLEATKKNGVVSLKTEKFTITRQKRVTIKVVDHEQAIEEMKARNIPVVVKTVLDDEVMRPTYKQLCENEEVPGFSSISTEFVTVRLAKPGK